VLGAAPVDEHGFRLYPRRRRRAPPELCPGRGAADRAVAAGMLAGMRLPVLLRQPDVEYIGCPSCGQPATLSNSPGRRRREWTCPTCRAAGSTRIAGHPTRHRTTPSWTSLPSA
jgi:hypothetical protein